MFFVDGFNIYHELHKNPSFHKYKWLNLRKLAENLVRKTETLSQVLYFTAYAEWEPLKRKRHEEYVAALTKSGVQTILGKFIPVTECYTREHNQLLYTLPSNLSWDEIPAKIEYRTYEEKRTDVNLAIKILDYAYRNLFDVAYVVTGDGDIAPAIEAVQKQFPNKSVTGVLPFKSPKRAKDIVQVCDSIIEITENDIKNAQLADEIIIDPQKTVRRPHSWK